MKMRLNSNKKKKIIFFFLLIIICIGFIWSLPRLSIPLLIAYVLYLIIEPTIPQLIKLGVGRNLAVIIIFLSLAIISIIPIVVLVPTIKTEVENVGIYLPKVETYIKTQYEETRLVVLQKMGVEISNEYLKNAIVYVTDNLQKIIINIPKLLASLLEWLLVIPFLLFFFLKDGFSFKRIILKLVPNEIFERTYYLSNELNKKIGDYIFAKFIEASIVGTIIFIGLLLMGVRFAFLLGIVAAFTNIIPYLGPFLGLLPAVILGLVEHGIQSPEFSGILFLYLAANIIDLGFVFPILVSKMVNLHPIIVVISVIIGSHYLGVAGMIISIPLAAAFKLVVTQIYSEIYGRGRVH